MGALLTVGDGYRFGSWRRRRLGDGLVLRVVHHRMHQHTTAHFILLHKSITEGSSLFSHFDVKNS
jgi:hypothetical protein